MSLAELLNVVDAAVYDIEAAHPELAAWASDCCDKIRDALGANDSAAAAWAAVQLGERLATIRNLGEIARLAASPPRLQRAHKKAVERCEAYWAEIERGHEPPIAYKRAAAKLGVDTKTIRRAQRFIKPE
jgi:hypothetical protein